jgi:hypothetical protein
MLFVLTGRLNAQNSFSYKEINNSIPLMQSGVYGENVNEIVQWNEGKQAPMPAGDYAFAKALVNKNRQNYTDKLNKISGYKNSAAELKPVVEKGFDGQITGSGGIPNDNHIAISNAGKVVSVQNSSIRVLDENGNTLMYKTLYQFANGKLQGFTNFCYDPRIVYDPVSDRFILFFLHEIKVASNFGVLAFSKTNDPAGEWNFYKIPGNAINNNKYSDYPTMAITKEDVVITLDLYKENSNWRVEMNESIIWQISKKEGYNGDSLKQKLYYDIRYKNNTMWSICPVQGGFMPTHPQLHLLTARPFDTENDTLFLHTISNTLKSGKAVLSLKILTTNKKYGVPPVAPQPKGSDSLQTNDTRVMGGIYHNGKIQYVQTTVIKPGFRSGVFHGMFDVNRSETVNATYITFDTVDYAYPSITYAGKGSPSDQASVIAFLHVSTKSYPGTSVIYHTQSGNLPSMFSEVVAIKKGLKGIERLPYDQYPHERWGDYTGIQYKYNEPGIVWISGSYGNTNSQNGTWVGKLKVKDKIELEADLSLDVFPNPIVNKTALGFYLEESQSMQAGLYNVLGDKIIDIFEGPLLAGYNELYFESDRLSPGIYYVRVADKNQKLNYTAKILR